MRRNGSRLWHQGRSKERWDRHSTIYNRQSIISELHQIAIILGTGRKAKAAAPSATLNYLSYIMVITFLNKTTNNKQQTTNNQPTNQENNRTRTWLLSQCLGTTNSTSIGSVTRLRALLDGAFDRLKAAMAAPAEGKPLSSLPQRSREKKAEIRI